MAFKKAKPAMKQKIEVDHFNTNALDNLLVGEEKPRSQTLAPKQNIKGEVEWDPFTGQYADDNLFAKANDVDSSEEDQADLDKLFDDPKISLTSTQSNTQKNSSNQRDSDPLSSSSGEKYDQFKTNKHTIGGIQQNYSQFGQMGYNSYATHNYNRFSAPTQPQNYNFNY